MTTREEIKQKELEGMRKQYKLYYAKNKEKELKRAKTNWETDKEKIHCNCGGSYTVSKCKSTRNLHDSSKRHQKYIEELKNELEDEMRMDAQIENAW
jgi:hypothetical protein